MVSGMVEYGMTSGAEAAARRRSGAGDAEIVAWLRKTVRPGHKVVAICSGALLAARAGLLDGRACTTHHACCRDLLLSLPPESLAHAKAHLIFSGTDNRTRRPVEILYFSDGVSQERKLDHRPSEDRRTLPERGTDRVRPTTRAGMGK